MSSSNRLFILTLTAFLDRLEASRKYLFGSVGVLGAANDSIISGAFILRGQVSSTYPALTLYIPIFFFLSDRFTIQDHKAVVDCAPDWESYNFQKLDVTTNGQGKEFFEAALAWDLEIDGKKWADGKNVRISVYLVALIWFMLTFLSQFK